MWSLGVVLLVPGVDEHARFEHRVELFDVEQITAHRAVEALHEGVLLRAGLLDEHRGDTVTGQPRHHACGDELPAIVRADRRRSSVSLEEFCEVPDHGLRADRARHTAAQRAARELIDDVQDADRPRATRRRADEVVRPGVVDAERRPVVRGVLAAALGPLAGGLLPARREAMTFEAPEALDALSVHRPALLAQQRPDRAVPPARML